MIVVNTSRFTTEQHKGAAGGPGVATLPSFNILQSLTFAAMPDDEVDKGVLSWMNIQLPGFEGVFPMPRAFFLTCETSGWRALLCCRSRSASLPAPCCRCIRGHLAAEKSLLEPIKTSHTNCALGWCMHAFGCCIPTGISFMDAGSMAVFSIACLVLYKLAARFAKAVDKATMEVADYTVVIKGLPETTPIDVSDGFNASQAVGSDAVAVRAPLPHQDTLVAQLWAHMP